MPNLTEDDIVNMSDEELANVDLNTIESTPIDENEVKNTQEEVINSTEELNNDDNITENKEETVLEDKVIDNKELVIDDNKEDISEETLNKTDEELKEVLEENKEKPLTEDKVEDKEKVSSDVNDESAVSSNNNSELENEDILKKDEAYDKIMAPFKANGKMIQLNNPEEVIQLMQQGANYTKKMQALQPKLKLLRTLENNNIGDVDKLNFLIDLDKKDPKAIHKLLRDSNIDPLNVDTSVESGYVPRDYSASDAQVNFESTSEDLMLTETGTELLKDVIQQWDKPSQESVYNDPTILTVLNQQKESGIYQTIVNEVEKRRMLGQISQTEPFINSYFNVGQSLQKENRLAPQVTPQVNENSQETRRVLDTRPAQTKAAVNTDKQAAAVAGNKTPAKSVKQDEFNPLSISDEEFMKKYKL